MKVPAMQEVDARTGEVLFTLSESHTIMRYLAVTRKCADHWYPSDAKQRALVDEYLDQHHSFLRTGCTNYFGTKLFSKVLGPGVYINDEGFILARLKRSLDLLE